MERDELLNQGISLMKDAITKYEDGDSYHANISRQQANDVFDKINTLSSTNEGRDDLKYNSTRNFGIIYNVIEENSGKLYRTKDGQKKLARLIKEIKSNKVLKEQFSYYNAITNPVNVYDAEKYTNEIMSIAPHFSRKELRENNNKLLSLIKDLNINEDVFIDSKKEELFENIEWTIINKKNANNLNEFIEHKNILNKNISENNKVIEENKNYYEELNNLTKKYESELNDDEKSLIEKISNKNANKSEIFEEYKKELINIIDEEIKNDNGNNVDNYNKWKETINEKKFNENSFLSDMTQLIDIKNILNE